VRILCFLVAFLLPQFVSAKDCGEPSWTTTVSLRLTVVTLRWNGVYEGADAVCDLTYPDKPGNVVSLQVWGQPIPNAAENLIAFLSCADDGCEKTLEVADIARGIVTTIQLPLSQPQIYLKAKWESHARHLLITGEKSEAVTLITCAVTQSITCTPTKPNQRLERP
jgi:hypothetical protein